MANHTRSIGEKLRAMEEHAARSGSIPASQPENKEPAEGSRETAGISNRPLSEEQRRQENVPPRGKSKGGGHA
jgi:hypothetical protein